MTTNGSTTTPKVISPSKLAHVVLRTNNFTKMKWYYETFLGGHSVFANAVICFITYDDEHHRIAIIGDPDLQNNPGLRTSGLEHIAFTFDTLQDLCTAYKQRKALGITPGWCVNHGPTTSMYYTDPDGNMLETQYDNFSTPEEATEMMMSEAFQKNFLGADFDPEELCRRVEEGEDVASIVIRKDVGPRGHEEVAALREQMRLKSQTGI